ncbi:MAG: YtxH domain-containing protein [Muribaculaceae bacterium]|jgi:gas vesicle protein
MKAFPLIAAALGGALVGAAAALLLAPQSGSETRDAIRDFIKSHVPNIKERDLNELADQIAEEIKDVK